MDIQPFPLRPVLENRVIPVVAINVGYASRSSVCNWFCYHTDLDFSRRLADGLSTSHRKVIGGHVRKHVAPAFISNCSTLEVKLFAALFGFRIPREKHQAF